MTDDVETPLSDEPVNPDPIPEGEDEGDAAITEDDASTTEPEAQP